MFSIVTPYPVIFTFTLKVFIIVIIKIVKIIKIIMMIMMIMMKF